MESNGFIELLEGLIQLKQLGQYSVSGTYYCHFIGGETLVQMGLHGIEWGPDLLPYKLCLTVSSSVPLFLSA